LNEKQTIAVYYSAKMPQSRKPRSGSMQYWPRKRAKEIRIRSWAKSNDSKMLGFMGYKVGMTHLIVNDNRPNSLTKNTEISFPVTIIECPSIKIASIRFYKNTTNGLKAFSEVWADNLDKELKRAIIIPKSTKKIEDVKDYDDIKLIANTQPRLTGIGKKKPDLSEIAIGGKKEGKLAYAKEKLGKEISIEEIFKEGQQLDFHCITKGKGFQGPVKRFGVHLRSHKSEKSVRNPGSLGPWCGQGHVMYRVAHAGKMGYHLRTEYNKQLLRISNKVEEINPKGGHIKYGIVRNNYILVKGSIGGPRKRLVRFNCAIRENKKITKEAPPVRYISK